MIKTIIFDNNGVLSQSSLNGGVQEMLDFVGIKKEDFVPVWEEEALRVDRGEVTTSEFLSNCLKRFNCKKDPGDFRKAYHRGYDPDMQVREFAKKLKNKFEVALLTNFGEDFEIFNKKWKMEEIFDKDKIFVSADLGMVKPDEDIYLYTLKKLGRKPEETVLIDDKLENIQTAEKIGMKTVHFKTLDKAEEDLENILECDYASK